MVSEPNKSAVLFSHHQAVLKLLRDEAPGSVTLAEVCERTTLTYVGRAYEVLSDLVKERVVDVFFQGGETRYALVTDVSEKKTEEVPSAPVAEKKKRWGYTHVVAILKEAEGPLSLEAVHDANVAGARTELILEDLRDDGLAGQDENGGWTWTGPREAPAEATLPPVPTTMITVQFHGGHEFARVAKGTPAELSAAFDKAHEKSDNGEVRIFGLHGDQAILLIDMNSVQAISWDPCGDPS